MISRPENQLQRVKKDRQHHGPRAAPTVGDNTEYQPAAGGGQQRQRLERAGARGTQLQIGHDGLLHEREQHHVEGVQHPAE